MERNFLFSGVTQADASGRGGDEERRGGQDNPRPEWLEYPNGLRLASPIFKGKTPCPGCRALPGQRHEVTCSLLPCPKCHGYYAQCDCTDPLIVESQYEAATVEELKKIINRLATEYTGSLTKLDEIGGGDRATLVRKAQNLEKIVTLQRAAQAILGPYTDSSISKMKQSNTLPRIVEQAGIMARIGRKLWLDWAYR